MLCQKLEKHWIDFFLVIQMQSVLILSSCVHPCLSLLSLYFFYVVIAMFHSPCLCTFYAFWVSMKLHHLRDIAPLLMFKVSFLKLLAGSISKSKYLKVCMILITNFHIIIFHFGIRSTYCLPLV